MDSPYLILLLREAFACNAGELGVRVEVCGSAVVLRGRLPNEERRQRVEGIARGVCGAQRVVNEIRVCPLAAAAPAETLR